MASFKMGDPVLSVMEICTSCQWTLSWMMDVEANMTLQDNARNLLAALGLVTASFGGDVAKNSPCKGGSLWPFTTL